VSGILSGRDVVRTLSRGSPDTHLNPSSIGIINLIVYWQLGGSSTWIKYVSVNLARLLHNNSI
jgi:hypothetical protein